MMAELNFKHFLLRCLSECQYWGDITPLPRSKVVGIFWVLSDPSVYFACSPSQTDLAVGDLTVWTWFPRQFVSLLFLSQHLSVRCII